MEPDFAFTLTLRGYDRAQVDQLIGRAQQALASGDTGQRAAARQALEAGQPAVRLRGYDRAQVDQAFAKLIADLG